MDTATSADLLRELARRFPYGFVFLAARPGKLEASIDSVCCHRGEHFVLAGLVEEFRQGLAAEKVGNELNGDGLGG